MLRKVDLIDEILREAGINTRKRKTKQTISKEELMSLLIYLKGMKGKKVVVDKT